MSVGEQLIIVPFIDTVTDSIVPVLVIVVPLILVALSKRTPWEKVPYVSILAAPVVILCLQYVNTVPLVIQVSTSLSPGHTGV